MPSKRTLYSLLILPAITLACAQGEEPAAEDDMGAAQEVAMDLEAPECYLARGTREEAEARVSPLSTTAFDLGAGQGLLCYGAPSANGREIMGALLTYGGPERIGANEPTTLHLNVPATVGGVALEPGSYSLYAIANADEWEFFLNSNYQRWGIPINEEVRATEVGSFTATPAAIDEMVETLRYRWDGDSNMGNLILEWENTQVAIHVMAR